MNSQEHAQLLTEKHDNTIKNIQELQEVEKYMYQNLEKLNAQEPDNIQQQRDIINRINDLTSMRTNLFDQLKQHYTTSQKDLDKSRDELADQLTLVGVVENQLNNVKKNIKVAKENHNNKLRMIEINNYAFERYNAHTSVMKLVVIICSIVLAFVIVGRYDIVPSNVLTSLISVTITVGLILLGKRVWDLYTRSNLNYNQYTFPLSPSQQGPGYQTVLEHDEIAFSKAFNQAQHSLSSGAKDLTSLTKTATSDLSSATKDLSSLTKGTFNATDKVNVGTKSNVSASQPKGAENFATYY